MSDVPETWFDKSDLHFRDDFIKFHNGLEFIVHLLLSFLATGRLQLPRKTMFLEEFRGFQSGQVAVSDCVYVMPQLIVGKGLSLHETSRKTSGQSANLPESKESRVAVP